MSLGGAGSAERWLRRRPGLGNALLAGALLVFLLPLSVSLVRSADPGTEWAMAMYAALLALHGAVALRLHAPVAAYVVCVVAELVLALAPNLHDPGTSAVYPAVLLPSSAAYLVTAYTASWAAGGAVPMLSLVTGVVGSSVVAARAWASGSTTTMATAGGGGFLVLAGLLLASVVAAWALGRFRLLRGEQMLALAERARRAEADRRRSEDEAAAAERARIARELHDVIAHSVTVMVRQAEGGRYVARTDPREAERVLSAIADLGREALTDIRSMLGVLDDDPGSPTMLGPQPRVDDVPALVDRMRSAGQDVRLLVDGAPQPLDRAGHLAAYRLVQEGLTNVAKHAGPRATVEVRLTWSDRLLRVEVCDHGGRPPADPVIAAGGRGLVGMRERVHLVGGTLDVGPSPSGGFRVVGEVPTVSGEGSDRS
jgi:signal transduction histidine kinase